MSYRAFKRLLGETSLERKCRFLFGGFTLLLISGSFWLYARQTEHLAYGQLETTCRLLVVQTVDHQLATGCRPVDQPAGSRPDQKQRAQAMDEFRKRWEKNWPDALKRYETLTIKADAAPEHVPDQLALVRIREFQADRAANEDSHLMLEEGKNAYYAAVRAGPSCIGCHKQLKPELEEGDLLAVVKIEVPTDSIADQFHRNRALLISTALVTALLIMGCSFVIVRYVIVKPVKHLKDVSDAISAGNLNVRSEIQTGDEFEDFSHAFNRMLRNLVAMQDRLRKVNNDLDKKVDELAQANLALYEMNRVKSQFLATVSHELKTPLHSILGFGEVLGTSAGLSDKQRRYVENIRTASEQLRAIISTILDLAKIEAGKMEMTLSTFDVADACEGLLAILRPMAEKKNIDLRGTYRDDLPPVRQDATKVRQILSNLLSNAIKFTPEGGRVTLRAEVEGRNLSLSVQDTGVGIAAEEQELVFEKFRQSGNLMTREHGGTGLGLSIVRELAKLLGGEVTLQSELGRGSTFTVRLPLTLSEASRLEFDVGHEGIDLSRAQRIDVRAAPARTEGDPPA